VNDIELFDFIKMKTHGFEEERIGLFSRQVMFRNIVEKNNFLDLNNHRIEDKLRDLIKRGEDIPYRPPVPLKGQEPTHFLDVTKLFSDELKFHLSGLLKVNEFLICRDLRGYKKLIPLNSLSKNIEGQEKVTKNVTGEANCPSALLDFDYSKEEVRAYFMMLFDKGYYSEEQVIHLLKSNFKGFSDPKELIEKVKLPIYVGLAKNQLMHFMFKFWFGQGRKKLKKNQAAQVLTDNFELFKGDNFDTIYNAMSIAPSPNYIFK
jgi:hypothetical protein